MDTLDTLDMLIAFIIYGGIASIIMSIGLFIYNIISNNNKKDK